MASSRLHFEVVTLAFHIRSTSNHLVKKNQNFEKRVTKGNTKLRTIKCKIYQIVAT